MNDKNKQKVVILADLQNPMYQPNNPAAIKRIKGSHMISKYIYLFNFFKIKLGISIN
mgnify:CR=1 FL=1